MNLANKITVSRFALTIIYFAILSMAKTYNTSAFIVTAFALFFIAILTDILDGYVARKYKIETAFGRIADPFVDKVLLCGSFIIFLTFDKLTDIYYAWMVILILAREFLIHAIRVAAEAKGIAFGATFWGKQKTVLQSITVLATLFYMAYLTQFPNWGKITLRVLVWLTVISTIFSGITYIFSVKIVFKSQEVKSGEEAATSTKL